jgi:hypothetical protein
MLSLLLLLPSIIKKNQQQPALQKGTASARSSKGTQLITRTALKQSTLVMLHAQTIFRCVSA